VLAEAVQQNQRKSILSELEGSNSSKSEDCQQPLASLEQNAEKVSMAYFSRLVEAYHQCLRSVLVRLFGVLGEFMQELYKMGVDEPQLFVKMMQFLEELLNFVLKKTFELIASKKLADNCQLVEFHCYIGPLLFWEEALQPLTQHKLFTLDYCHASEHVERENGHLGECLTRLRQAKS